MLLFISCLLLLCVFVSCVVSWLLLVGFQLLFVVCLCCALMCVVCCLLFVDCCLLCVVCCSLIWCLCCLWIVV